MRDPLDQYRDYRNYREDYYKQLALSSAVLPEKETIDEAMARIPSEWQYRWCEPQGFGCACMGAANCSGRLGGRFTKEEWLEWVHNHPPVGDETATKFIKDGKYDFEGHREWMFGIKQKEFEEAMKKFTIC